MEQLGLIIFAALFVLSGINHIRNHAAMAGYTASVLPDSLKPLSFLGGAPAGVYLVAAGTGAAFNDHAIYAYGLAAFLALATALFHRDFYKEPGGMKGVALLGAALYIASQVA